jgi:O-antigen/teichoic acid export membrane protein
MSLAQRATHGVVWTIGVALTSRFLGLVGTLVLTRFLAPEVMGEVVTATVVAFVANWATQIGTNQYILVRGEREREALFHASVLSIGLAVAALVLLTLTASYIAPLVNSPSLAIYLPGMALAMFIRRIGSVPDKLLLGRMRFRAVAGAAALGEVVFTASSIVLVMTTDLGGMAIVIANIVQASVTASIEIYLCGVAAWLTPHRLRWARMKEIFRFGLPLGAEAFLYESARYGDKLVYTRMFGAARTGEYNLAYNLADLPASYIGEQVSNVLLPTLLRVDAARRVDFLVRAIGMLALVTFPMAAGLSLVSYTLVDVLLPDRWQGVAPFLAILAVMSVFRPVNGLISQYLVSVERNGVLLSAEVLRVAVLFGGLVLLGLLGPLVASFAVGLASFVQTCALVRSIRGDGRFVRLLIAALRGPALACGAMATVVMVVRAGFGPADGVRESVLLGLEIAAGALAYAAAMLVIGRAATFEALALARGVLRPRRA